jgi:hypothetical protein
MTEEQWTQDVISLMCPMNNINKLAKNLTNMK